MHLKLGPGFFHFVINALNNYLFCFQHWQELSIVHKNTKKPVNCTHKNASNMIVQIIASKSQLSCAVVEQIGMSTTFATVY